MTRTIFIIACVCIAVPLAGCDRDVSSSLDARPAAGSIESQPLNEARASDGPLFELLDAAQTGVDFESRFDWEHPRRDLYTHGYAGGGVCVGDYDGDDRPDIYLVSQTGRDRLYRQVDDFRFEDVTDDADLDGDVVWGTGATFVDIDNDGDLDLYVCNYDAPNFLYVNAGDGTFREAGEQFGIAFDGASIMAGFADYDRDGDLDLYLVTNRIYPGPGLDQPELAQVGGRTILAPGQEETYAMQLRSIDGEQQKFVVKAGQRDRLFRNGGDGTFTDASDEVGISGNHPGLSAKWWDYDHDGWPDIYVCNDFWDADRLYHNNGDGTFDDLLGETMPHTPWFSMGSDSADLDNDGRIDLIAADMSATTHYMSKIMMGDMNESRWFLQSAEPRQYMRNAVYLNTGTERFMEVANLTGLASTDWTWSVKLGDLDNDGRVDVFFTNGTANHSFDPDLTQRLRALEQDQMRRRVADPMKRWQEQWALYRQVPPRREKNVAFRNNGDLQFEKTAQSWGLGHEGISFGAAYADFDRDGDLDLVVSNVDDPVSIYRNGGTSGSRILVQLRGRRSNRRGIGAEVVVSTGAGRLMRQLAPMSGYMSANEPVLHFGLGDAPNIERLDVHWPSGRVQTFEDLATGRRYTITEPIDEEPPAAVEALDKMQFREAAVDIGFGSDIVREQPFDDYASQPLLPARLSRMGPGLAWADADGDGDEDLYVGGSAGRTGRLYINEGDGAFRRGAPGAWVVDKASEDMAALWLDADRDGDMDLYVASGGVEHAPQSPALRDRLYHNDGAGHFTKAPRAVLPDVVDSSSVVAGADYDGDGDIDLFIGSRSIPGQYPLTPASRLLRNDDGTFVDVTDTIAPGLGAVGLVTSALWSDVDGDAQIDLFVTLEWGPVALWMNTGKAFENQTGAAGLAERTGWWNSIAGADFDGDDDIDYVVMNAGLNTKYAASPEKPVYLYYGDLDQSGRMSLVEAKPGSPMGTGEERMLPVRGLSCSSSAMPIVRERLPTYRQFALASLEDIYTPKCLQDAQVLSATHLESGILINESTAEGGVRFEYRVLPRLVQASPGHGVVASDFDGDGHVDIYCVQNFFWREPETGRWDGGISLLLRGDGTGNFEPEPATRTGLIVPGDARGLATSDINGDGRPDLTVTRNDDRMMVFLNEIEAARTLAVRLRGAPGNPTGVGARVSLVEEGGRSRTAEVYGGGGYLSQSSGEVFFGLGAFDGPLEVRVRWPDGSDSKQSVPADVTDVTVRR